MISFSFRVQKRQIFKRKSAFYFTIYDIDIVGRDEVIPPYTKPLHFQSSIIYQPNEPNGLENP